jgi:hypothetical protein
MPLTRTTAARKLVRDDAVAELMGVEILRSLPENIQATAGRAIMGYVAIYEEVRLPDAQAAEAERRIDDPNRTFCQ